MHRAIALLVFLAVWLCLERNAYRRRSQKSFRRLWIYLEKAHSPDPLWPPLFFATLSTLFFSIWEFLVRWALMPDDRFFSLSVVVGVLGWALFLWLRIPKISTSRFQSSIAKISPPVLWLLWIASTQVLLRSWFCLVLLIWVFYRAQFLKQESKTLSQGS